MMELIAGKFALVTGATRGIGKSIASALAAEGCHLILSARTGHALKALQEELNDRYPAVRIEYVAADCRDKEAIKRIAAFALHEFPELDILVNNVGWFKAGGILEEEEDTLVEHFMVNVWCAHYLSTFFGKQMCIRKKGHIFTIGSVAGKMPFAKAASYSVTKHALHGLTGILRKEFSQYGVKVTEIIPGATYTSSWEGVDIPEEKFVAAADIAAAVLNCLKMNVGTNVDEIVIRPLDERIG